MSDVKPYGQWDPAVVREKSLAVLSMISGGMSMRKAAEAYGVSAVTFLSWMARKEWAEHYALAVKSRAMELAEKAVEDANDSTLLPNDRRVRLDAARWFCEILDRPRFGQKVQQEVTGPGGGPLQHAVVAVGIDPGNAYLELLKGAVRAMPDAPAQGVTYEAS